MALESFQETSSLADTLAALNHAPTFACITAGRRFLELLQAGCTTPIGIHTRIDGPDLHLKAPVFPENGGPPLEAAITAPLHDPLAAAQTLHDRLR